MNTASPERRHDLDALRAVAMLLGVGLHGAMSFADVPWVVQDTRQNDAFGVFVAAVHGFRMPAFFVMSGFFTAMLWRQRGLVTLLRHRFRRIFLPLLLGLFTVVPAVNWISARALESPVRQNAGASERVAVDKSDMVEPAAAATAAEFTAWDLRNSCSPIRSTTATSTWLFGSLAATDRWTCRLSPNRDPSRFHRAEPTKSRSRETALP